MNVLQWLKVGISLFLIISKPQIDLHNDFVKTKFEISNLLTDEMINLLNNGTEFEYETYVSIIGIDNSNKKKLIKFKILRKIKYDYLTSLYYFLENNKLINSYKSIDLLLNDAKKYDNIIFNINPKQYNTFSMFVEIKLLENPIIEKELKMKTSDLWNGYKPSIKFNFDSTGAEIK